jgi:hypothetical protein
MFQLELHYVAITADVLTFLMQNVFLSNNVFEECRILGCYVMWIL